MKIIDKCYVRAKQTHKKNVIKREIILKLQQLATIRSNSPKYYASFQLHFIHLTFNFPVSMVVLFEFLWFFFSYIGVLYADLHWLPH